MTDSRPIRVGIMGFGQTGRQIYELASRSDDVEVVAVADIGKPEILHYLLCSEVGRASSATSLQGNFPGQPAFPRPPDANRPTGRNALGYFWRGYGYRFHR